MARGLSKAGLKALRTAEQNPERKAARRLGLLPWEYRALRAELGREPTNADVGR